MVERQQRFDLDREVRKLTAIAQRDYLFGHVDKLLDVLLVLQQAASQILQKNKKLGSWCCRPKA